MNFPSALSTTVCLPILTLQPLATTWQFRAILPCFAGCGSCCTFLSCLCSRMVLLKHAFQPIESDMGINLGGGDVGVSQQGLDSAQIGAIFHHVSSAAVAKHVWAGVASNLCRSRNYHLPNS